MVARLPRGGAECHAVKAECHAVKVECHAVIDGMSCRGIYAALKSEMWC